MIDTDKYEGHYSDDFARFWVTADNKLNADIDRARATEYLIDDAPLLLAEVKRMYEREDALVSAIKELCDSEDSTGCGEDLTVVRLEPMLKLMEMIE